MKPLSEADHQRIREAVAAAEARTSGEIVPVVAPQSGRYEVAVWRGAAGAALLALAVLMVVFQFYSGWGLGWLHTGWGTALVVVGCGTLGALAAAYVPAVRRALVGSDTLDQRVHARAKEAFLDEEVFATRDRTGILLYVSLFEHRVEVLGDAGINAKVTADDWADVVDGLRSRLRDGRLVDGLIEALDACGALLERAGVAIRSDDENELPDRVRLRE